MPVRRPIPGSEKIDSFKRLSASQVVAWKNCPRIWYYGWKEKLKSPLPPQILRGIAVEECVCRVLRESPAFISDDSEISMKTPLDDSGSPDLDKSTNWIGPKLKPLDKTEFPKNNDGLIRVTFGSFNTKEDAVIALRSIRDNENKYAWILTISN